MVGESGKLGRRPNRERSEQDQEWWSAQPGRRQAARAMDTKWRGKGFTLQLLVIYRSRGAMPLGTPRAAAIKCRQRHQPLTSGPTVLKRPCTHTYAIITAR
jgi:hypothetical protein